MSAENTSRKNIGSLEERAFVAVMRAAETLQWGVAELLKPYDLSSAQYNALRILRGAGAEGLSCSEIASRLINRDPDITRLLGRLQKRGLVKRSSDKIDRRIVLTHITKAGVKLVNAIDEPMHELHRTRLGDIGDQGLNSLITLLQNAQK